MAFNKDHLDEIVLLPNSFGDEVILLDTGEPETYCPTYAAIITDEGEEFTQHIEKNEKEAEQHISVMENGPAQTYVASCQRDRLTETEKNNTKKRPRQDSESESESESNREEPTIKRSRLASPPPLLYIEAEDKAQREKTTKSSSQAQAELRKVGNRAKKRSRLESKLEKPVKKKPRTTHPVSSKKQCQTTELVLYDEELISKWELIKARIGPLAEHFASRALGILTKRSLDLNTLSENDVKQALTSQECNTIQLCTVEILQSIKNTALPLNWIIILSNIFLFRECMLLSPACNTYVIYSAGTEILKRCIRN